MKRHAGHGDDRDTSGGKRARTERNQAPRWSPASGAHAVGGRYSSQPRSTEPQRLVDQRDSADVPVVRTLITERETDEHRLSQRQKQIDFGKNTLGYDRYCAQVPRHKRRKGVHPMTPDRTLKVSKKRFDGMVRRWRQDLHKYDPPEQATTATPLPSAQAVAADERSPPAAVSNMVEPSTHTPIQMDDTASSDQARSATSAQPPIAGQSSEEGPSIFDNFGEGNHDEGDDDDDDDDLL